MNSDRRLFLVALSAAGTAWALEPLTPHCATTRPALLCGIPPADYAYGPRSPSVFSTSRVGLLLPNDAGVASVLTDAPLGARSEDSIQSFERLTRPSGDQLQIERGRTESELDFDGSRRRERSAGENSTEVLPFPAERRRGLFGLFGSREDESEPPISGNRTETQREVRTTSVPPRPRTLVTRRLYQLAENQLAIEHCAVSELALVLASDGVWTLSLLAVQNAPPADPSQAAYNPRLYIRRNEFHVELCCFGAAEQLPAEGVRSGRPVQAMLQPCVFWVQNGEPHRVHWEGHSRYVANRVSEIDRVEVEFYYR